MKYLKTFNESIISGDDFYYKEISSDEYFDFDSTHNTIKIEKETRDNISNLIKTDKEEIGDMISFREFNGDDYYSYYYICDGWEGLEKFIDDKI